MLLDNGIERGVVESGAENLANAEATVPAGARYGCACVAGWVGIAFGTNAVSLILSSPRPGEACGGNSFAIADGRINVPIGGAARCDEATDFGGGRDGTRGARLVAEGREVLGGCVAALGTDADDVSCEVIPADGLPTANTGAEGLALVWALAVDAERPTFSSATPAEETGETGFVTACEDTATLRLRSGGL